MNFKLVRGDDYVFNLEFTENGVAKDITGWTIFFTLKKDITATDENADLKKDVTSHSDPTNGKTEIKLTNAETDALDGPYHYDIQYKDTATPANIKTVIIGTMSFETDVTRRAA